MKFTKMALALLFVAGSAQAGFGKTYGAVIAGNATTEVLFNNRNRGGGSSRRVRRLERENEDLRDELASLKRRCRR